MGAGSSIVDLNDEQELQVYKRMKTVCEAKLSDAEDERELMNLLRTEYNATVAAVTGTTLAKVQSVPVLEKLASGTEHTQLTIGDIVRARPEDEAIFYEGIVVQYDANYDGRPCYQIDFGEDEIVWVPAHNVQRVLPWGTLEVGDKVQAKPVDEENYYEGFVAEIHFIDGEAFYDIAYNDCDDFDAKLPAARVRKLNSARSSLAKFKGAVRTIQAVNVFKGFAIAESKTDEAKGE